MKGGNWENVSVVYSEKIGRRGYAEDEYGGRCGLLASFGNGRKIVKAKKISVHVTFKHICHINLLE